MIELYMYIVQANSSMNKDDAFQPEDNIDYGKSITVC